MRAAASWPEDRRLEWEESKMELLDKEGVAESVDDVLHYLPLHAVHGGPDLPCGENNQAGSGWKKLEIFFLINFCSIFLQNCVYLFLFRVSYRVLA